MCETENPSNQAEMFLSPSCTRCLCTVSLGLARQLRGVTGHPKGLAVCIHPPQHVSLGLRAQDGCRCPICRMQPAGPSLFIFIIPTSCEALSLLVILSPSAERLLPPQKPKRTPALRT